MGLWRFDVRPRPGLHDPHATHIAALFRAFGIASVKAVHTSRLFLIDLQSGGSETERTLAERVAAELLTDPLAEVFRCQSQADPLPDDPTVFPIEVHLKPGIMDNVADSTILALADMGIKAVNARTARRYELSPAPADAELKRIRRLLGNDCIEDVLPGTRPIEPPTAARPCRFVLRHVAIRDLDETALLRLSRQAHLFLSGEELHAIQAHYRALGRDPTDLELETLAQTWSEHCVHKTLKSPVVYRGAPMPSLGDPTGRPESSPLDVEIRYDNLLADTIAKATATLIAAGRGPRCLSVFEDNAGAIAFDDQFAVAFKVETHNHPSAIEPYGGAATGVGGVIRDVLGFGLAAKPFANTSVFCVAPPDWPTDAVPKGVIHPRSVLQGIVAGVRDYGNCMGIPTVNGAVHFDHRYLGNPLVFCGCLGLIPRNRIAKRPNPGDAIVLIGGRTGRDGIHGATFSSAELSDSHEEEFAHAVQIGSPIQEKMVLDFLLLARDHPAEDGSIRCLYSAVTDCGAGGLSSAVGELAAHTGAEVNLEDVPLKYTGLRYDEIWISESQERMVLAVPASLLHPILALAADEDVQSSVIGRFTDSGRLIVRYRGTTVGDLDLTFLHKGLPKNQRLAEWPPPAHRGAAGFSPRGRPPGLPFGDTSRATGLSAQPSNSACRLATSSDPADPDVAAQLKSLLANPTTASKHWIVRQYDHEVLAGSVVKPLVGPWDGPSDAAVIRPRLDSTRGVAIACGLAPHLADLDPYWMAVAAIDEALRNVVCVGGDPARTAILDNFCWPRVDRPDSMGALVRACQACHDLALAYGLPFISGKDSLNNEFALDPADLDDLRSAAAAHPSRAFLAGDLVTDGRIAIPYSLLISAVSILDDVNSALTMDAKPHADRLLLVGQPTRGLHDEPLASGSAGGYGFSPRDRPSREQSAAAPVLPLFDAPLALRTHQTVARLIREGLICAAHDVSEGGPLVTCAEMCLAGWRSCTVTADPERFFIEAPALYLVQLPNDRVDAFRRLLGDLPHCSFAALEDRRDDPLLTILPGSRPAPNPIPLADLYRAWRSPLDW